MWAIIGESEVCSFSVIGSVAPASHETDTKVNKV